jgi:glycosyltransferase involved in cell wall biosynthesis
MHILHVINNLNKGGAERLLVDNLPLYKKEGIDADVLQLSDHSSEPTYVELLQKNGVKCHRLSTGSIYNPFLILKIIRFLKDSRFDIVHVHLFPALYWVAIASKFVSKRPKLVFTEHSTQNKRSKNSLLRTVERAIYNCYDEVIAISDQIKKKLIDWTRIPGKISVIRNGVDTGKFMNAAKYDETYFFNNLGIPPGSVKILMTARFSYPKDHATIVEALQKLPENHYLILVGEGPNKQKIEDLTKHLGVADRTVFAGFRNDIPSLMKSVDINVLSTEYEGMSGVSLEAMASGTPFLGSDVAGINDLVPDSRYLFSAGSSLQAAESIRKTVEDISLNNAMRQEGIQHAMKFDISLNIKKHISLYSKS